MLQFRLTWETAIHDPATYIVGVILLFILIF